MAGAAAVMLMLGVTACGDDGGGDPQAAAQRITTEYAEDNRELFEALDAIDTEATFEDYAEWDPVEDCRGLYDEPTDEEIGAAALYMGETLKDAGLDVVGLVKLGADYHRKIQETGACEGYDVSPED